MGQSAASELYEYVERISNLLIPAHRAAGQAILAFESENLSELDALEEDVDLTLRAAVEIFDQAHSLIIDVLGDAEPVPLSAEDEDRQPLQVEELLMAQVADCRETISDCVFQVRLLYRLALGTVASRFTAACVCDNLAHIEDPDVDPAIRGRALGLSQPVEVPPKDTPAFQQIADESHRFLRIPGLDVTEDLQVDFDLQGLLLVSFSLMADTRERAHRWAQDAIDELLLYCSVPLGQLELTVENAPQS